MKNILLSLFQFAFLFLLPFSLLGQSPKEQTVDRDEYFRRLEERALKISQKFAEISGTEPVRLFTPRKKNSSVSDLQMGALPPQEGLDTYQSSSTAFPQLGPNINEPDQPSQQFLDDEVIEYQPTVEDRRGVYFLRPFIALQVPNDSQHDTIGAFESSLGYALGIHAGKRIENFTAGVRLNYMYNELANEQSGVVTELENELFALVGTLGFSTSITEKVFLDFGLGIGFGKRFNGGETYFPGIPGLGIPPWTVLISGTEKTVFTYDFSLLLDYAYSDNLSAFAGYRFLGASKNGSYDRIVSHLFEVGVGANF